MSQFPPNPNAPKAGPAGSGQLVLIGFAIAIIAVILMNFYVEMRVAASKEETITYYRFKEEMRAGEQINDRTDLEKVQIPISFEDAFGTSAVKPAEDGRPNDGRSAILLTPVREGQLLTYNLFRSVEVRVPRDPEDRGLDEITLNIDSKKQTPNLRPGDRIDLRASVPLNRDARFMVIMEYVKVVNLGDRIQETGTRSKNEKYGSITIYVEPGLSNKLLDIQERVRGQTFSVTRRDPQAKEPRVLKEGGSKEINEEVLDIFNLK